ncbi:hypothetical protein [Hydrogenophaga sp. A37]|uniref:hypothetical protein n=1 Tax=Hydrogenophaga sp. A37 TaxID=1945864 RepID=UPI0015C521BD|nr:hypothetical protein [Hydrogenophaga sp. A37]
MNHDHSGSGTPSTEPTPADAEQGDMTKKTDISENVQRHHLTGLCFFHVDEKDMAQLAPAAAKRLEGLLTNGSWLADIHGPQDVFQLVLYPLRFGSGSGELTTRQDRSDEGEKPLGNVETQVVEWGEAQPTSMSLEVSDELVIVLHALEETGKAKLAPWTGRPIQPPMVWELLPTWQALPWLEFPSTVLASGGSTHHSGGISMGISTRAGIQADHTQVRKAFEAWMRSVGPMPDPEGAQ